MTGLVNVAIVVLLLATGETETREVRYPVNDNVPAGRAGEAAGGLRSAAGVGRLRPYCETVLKGDAH